MADPQFQLSARRSFAMPIVLALAALALAVAIAVHFYPATSVDIAHVRTQVVSTHTVYKNDSILLGNDRAEDMLFVATTLRVDDKLRVPIYLEDFKLTLTDQNGAELTVKAVEKRDLESLQTNFPALKPMLAEPLLRDTTIEPGHAASGTLVFPLTLPQSAWEARKSAIVTVGLYHLPTLYQSIPKD